MLDDQPQGTSVAANAATAGVPSVIDKCAGVVNPGFLVRHQRDRAERRAVHAVSQGGNVTGNAAHRTGFDIGTATVVGLPRSTTAPLASSPDQVDAVLRAIPSHGWPAGWVGRRDRALLLLSQLAGLSYPQIAALTAGDVAIADGVASIRTIGGRTTLRQVEDDLLCGPCALARWVHALDLTVIYPDGWVVAALIARAVPLTSDSPHLCESRHSITELTARVALLPPIDGWGRSVREVPSIPVTSGRSSARRRGGFLPVQRTHHSSTGTHDPARRAQLLSARVSSLLHLRPTG